MTAPPAFDRRLYAPMVLGAVLNPINSSMIAVALVPIGIAFGADPAQTAWLVSGLYLVTAIGQPVVGRLIDLFGPRRLYLAAATVAGLGGIVGTLAPSLGVLVAARVLIGIGTCAGFPAAMSLIRSEADRTGHESPAAVLTVLSVSAQTIAVIGPTLGGLLIGLGDWRAVFAVNVPLALACLVLGSRHLPRARPPADRPRAGLDLVGVALFATVLVPLLLFLMDPHGAEWTLLGVATAAAIGFLVYERRTSDPFVDVRALARNRPQVATYLRTVLAFVFAYAVLYGYSQWLQADRSLSPSAAGLVLLPMSLTAVGVALLTGRRPEVRGKLVVGALMQVAATVMFLLLDATTPYWALLALSVLLGVPQGLLNLANQNALYHQADPAHLGSAAGLLRTSGYIGALIAAAANGLFLGAGADTAGLHRLAGFLLAVAVVLLAVTVPDRSLRRTS